LEAMFILLEFPSPSRRIFIGSHSLPPSGSPNQHAKRYVASCPECQSTGNISQRNAMPLNYNLQIYIFDIWGIDFMGPFTISNEHILVMVDYVSKWVEVIPCRRASTEESISMIKNVIFPRYGVSRV
jgi:hypothetical protein